MALLSGFNTLSSANDTFSDWLQKTNEMITLIRDDVVTANSTIANTVGNARLLGTLYSNTVHIVDELVGSDGTNTSVLTIGSNVAISSNSSLSVDQNVTVGGYLDYTLVSNNYTNLIPSADSTYSLGNSTVRWAALYVDTLDVSTSATLSGNTVITDLEVTNSVSLPATSFTGNVDFVNINVSGVANIASLEITELVANGVALVANSGDVSTNTATIIDSFPKTQSRGFKYLVQGQSNGVSTSAYVVEIAGAHNNTDAFFTRYGEIVNSFDATLTVQINGANVELLAECPSASGPNTHSFNVARTETR